MMFRHPKYYKELRKRNREVLRSGRGLAVNQAPHVSDQVISNAEATAASERAPDQGHKQQASSSKHQAPSVKLSNQPGRAASHKPLSHKHRP